MKRISDRTYAAGNEAGETGSVRAAWRTAQLIIAKGAIAKIGIERRHSSHASPTIIVSHREVGAAPRLLPWSNAITANGIAAKIDGVLSSPPGRVSLLTLNADNPGVLKRKVPLSFWPARSGSVRPTTSSGVAPGSNFTVWPGLISTP